MLPDRRRTLMQALVDGHLTIDQGVRAGLTKADSAEVKAHVIGATRDPVSIGMTNDELDAIKALGRSLSEG